MRVVLSDSGKFQSQKSYLPITHTSWSSCTCGKTGHDCLILFHLLFIPCYNHFGLFYLHALTAQSLSLQPNCSQWHCAVCGLTAVHPPTTSIYNLMQFLTTIRTKHLHTWSSCYLPLLGLSSNGYGFVCKYFIRKCVHSPEIDDWINDPLRSSLIDRKSVV